MHALAATTWSFTDAAFVPQPPRPPRRPRRRSGDRRLPAVRDAIRRALSAGARQGAPASRAAPWLARLNEEAELNASNALMLVEAIRRERYAAFVDQPERRAPRAAGHADAGIPCDPLGAAAAEHHAPAGGQPRNLTGTHRILAR